MRAPTTSLLSSGKRSRFSGSLHGSPPSLPSTAVIKRRHDPNWPTPNFVNLKEAKLPIRVSCASPPVERWSLYQLPQTTTQPSNQLLHTTTQPPNHPTNCPKQPPNHPTNCSIQPTNYPTCTNFPPAILIWVNAGHFSKLLSPQALFSLFFLW